MRRKRDLSFSNVTWIVWWLFVILEWYSLIIYSYNFLNTINQTGHIVGDNDRHLPMEPEVVNAIPCASCLPLSVCVCLNEGGLREGGGKTPDNRQVWSLRINITERFSQRFLVGFFFLTEGNKGKGGQRCKKVFVLKC